MMPPRATRAPPKSYNVKPQPRSNGYSNDIKVPSKGYNLDNLPPEAFMGGSEVAAQKHFNQEV
jgi:hypothetical protein